MHPRKTITIAVLFLILALTAAQAGAMPKVWHRTAQVDGLEIFYREAGPADAPTLLLLHGFPTSSHMYRDLIPALADRYHVIAPDYPGYGNSSMPAVDEFDYTFDNLAAVVEKLLGAEGHRPLQPLPDGLRRPGRASASPRPTRSASRR